MDKNKKSGIFILFLTLIDVYGYSTGIATAWAMFIILNNIKTYGITYVWHSTGDFLLCVEIISIISFILFCVYKFFRNMIDREKIRKYELKLKIYEK